MGQLKDASHLLERCLELAPDFHAARHSYAMILMRLQKPEAAIHEAEKLLALEPNNPNFLTLKASILVRIGDQAGALEIYEKVLKNYPNQARAQMSYGHTLKTVGRLDESIEAYKKCIRLSPEVGEAYWSLANLKTFRFSDEDIENMRKQVTSRAAMPMISRIWPLPWVKPWKIAGNTTNRSSSTSAATPSGESSIATASKSMFWSRCGRFGPCRKRFLSNARVGVARRLIRFSSWDCRAPAQPCWSRFWPAIHRSRALRNCRISSRFPENWAPNPRKPVGQVPGDPCRADRGPGPGTG